jgi:alpha-mannosidase
MGDISATSMIGDAIARLHRLTRQDRQGNWQATFEQATFEDVPPEKHFAQWENWDTVELNERQHIAWPGGRQVLWLGQRFEVPFALADYPLQGLTARLALTWWADQADIYINGKLVQQGDLFDCSARVVLSEAVYPGEVIHVALRLVSPGHDAGALVRSQLLYEPSDCDRIDPGMVADELAVLETYLKAFKPEALATLEQSIQCIDWGRCADAFYFEQSLEKVRHALLPLGDWLKQRQIGWVGHAHLDLAWLWPVAETWEAAERTFQSVLNLQKNFNELIFCHSSPALYDWLEQNRPQLFGQIRQQVAAGRWEVAAGMWVEPELNLVSGESLVRQVMYGQHYTQSRFGQISRVAWLPDSFGFCWQLPQILKQGGVDYFMTQKLRWNDTTQFPHEVFYWEAPDGTRVLSIMTPPIGESVDPIKMSGYAQTWESKTGLKESLWLPGVGDHGGGPTRDMLEVGRRWQTSPLFPALKPTTALALCQTVEATLSDPPIWADELYLEFHRGCYTSHADQKRYNRRCEHWLTEAELFSAIATLIAQQPYPKAELETAWKRVLFNQFHDILPGSSIPQVFTDANEAWEIAQKTALELREQALEAIATQVDLSHPTRSDAVPVVVYNSLNWERSEVVEWRLPTEFSGNCMLLDAAETPSPSHYDAQSHSIRFFAPSIPSLGYRVFWCCPAPALPPIVPPQHWILENDFLRVEICAETGNMQSICDRQTQREVLSKPGNVLQFFQDQGQYWDAWNIDPAYAQNPLEDVTLKSIRWISWSAVEQRIQVVREWRNSEFVQEYVLEMRSPVLKIETQVDWQETHVLVKAAFPVTVSADYATYEIPCGAIQRPTLPNTTLSQEQQAKWEVPALHWADLTELGETPYGISLLNDCKYGYDAQPDCLRLTLLRSPVWPDPDCDRGRHEFVYAVYPHSGNWQTAETVQQGYSLNRPLIARAMRSVERSAGSMGDRRSFLSTSDKNLVLMAFKQSETSEQDWILRFYESYGQPATGKFQTSFPLQYQSLTDSLEHPIDLGRTVGPWQIQSQQWFVDDNR